MTGNGVFIKNQLGDEMKTLWRESQRCGHSVMQNRLSASILSAESISDSVCLETFKNLPDS